MGTVKVVGKVGGGEDGNTGKNGHSSFRKEPGGKFFRKFFEKDCKVCDRILFIGVKAVIKEPPIRKNRGIAL